MSRRSQGRPSPSRGARVERRKAERGPVTRMAIPDGILSLAPVRVRPPCPIDPLCRIDHLKRKKGARRG